MNDDDRLTPEERKLIEAALALRAEWPNAVISFGVDSATEVGFAAAAAYRKATAPPEPFDRWFVRLSGRTWDDIAYPDPERAAEGITTSHIWRCTVTPIERVRR